MSTDPTFFGITVVGSNTPNASADATYTAPTHTVTLLGGQGPRQVVDGITSTSAGTPAGTTLVSNTASFNSGDIGRPVSAAGVPTGTVISTILSAASVSMSQPATATASGVTVTLGGGLGTKVEQVVWAPNGVGASSSVGVIPLYLYDGTTYHLRDAAPITATVPSTTVAPVTTNFPNSPYTSLWIPPTWSLVFSSTVANQLVTVTATGGNA